MKQLAALLGLLLLFGCTFKNGRCDLVEISEVRPRRLEALDPLAIRGAGFPAGRTAEVVLRGELLRAGEPSIEGFEYSSTAEVSSPHTLEVLPSAGRTRALCGSPEARHTTFRGIIEVRFEPNTSTGSAVGGTARGVVLELMPDRIPEASIKALRAEAERYGRFVGATWIAAEDGVMVSDLTPNGRAAQGGLEVGDLITEFHRMVARDPADMIPPPNARSSALAVRRGSDSLPLRLDSSGFRTQSPRSLSLATLLLGLVLVPLGILASSAGRLLGVLDWRFRERWLAVRANPPGSEGILQTRVLRPKPLASRLPPSLILVVTLVALHVLFGLLSIGEIVVARELDLPLLFAGASASEISAALVRGGAGPRWSLRAGLTGSLAALVLSLPVAFVLLLAVLRVGSLAPGDFVGAQGAAPWRWLLFDSPFSLLAGLLCVLALVPSVQSGSPLGFAREARYRPLFTVSEWCHRFVIAGLLSIVLLGGWQLPTPSNSGSAAVAGALFVLIKCWIILGFIAALRWILGGVRAPVALGTLSVFLVLPALMCVLLALIWQDLRRGPTLATLDQQLGPILFGAAAVLAVHRAARLLRAARTRSLESGPQIWL